MVKNRTGFVSNSSSSSFIIAAKEVPKIKIEMEFNNFEVIESYETYCHQLLEDWGNDSMEELLQECSHLMEEAAKAKASFNKGLKLYKGFCSSDDCDDVAGYAMYVNGMDIPKSDDYEVIKENES